MLNKMMQKTRNSKLDEGASLGSGRSTQYASFPAPAMNACPFSSKATEDSQKASLVGSTNNASLLSPSSQHSLTNLKITLNQVITNAGYQASQSHSSINNQNSISSSENFIFTSSAPRISSPQQNQEVFSCGSPLGSNTAPLVHQLTTSAKDFNDRNCSKSKSNFTSPVGVMTSSVQSVDLFTPKQTKLRPFEQPIFAAQRVAVNLNNRQEFAENQQNKQEDFQDQTKKYLICRQSADPSLRKQNELSTLKEQEYQASIKTLESQVSVLISELDRQVVLSNSALQDNTMFRKKYHDLKDSAQKLQQSQQTSAYCNGQRNRSSSRKRSDSGGVIQELNEVKVIEMQEENKRLKVQLASSTQEVQAWRNKYEVLNKQFEEHDEAIKIKLSSCFEKQITVLNQELVRFKLSGSQHKFKKTNIIQSIRASGKNNLASSNAFKENNTTNIAQRASHLNSQPPSLGEDWHVNYNILKEEKEKKERVMKKKIESLEEQNAFLQNESQQTLRSNSALLESQCLQQTQHRSDAKNSNIKELNTYFSKNLDIH